MKPRYKISNYSSDKTYGRKFNVKTFDMDLMVKVGKPSGVGRRVIIVDRSTNNAYSHLTDGNAPYSHVVRGVIENFIMDKRKGLLSKEYI